MSDPTPTPGDTPAAAGPSPGAGELLAIITDAMVSSTKRGVMELWPHLPALAAGLERLAAQDEGREAAERGMPDTANPYTHPDARHYYWRDGYWGERSHREAAKLREQLDVLTTPRPIDELHEDDGEVLLQRWRDGALELWEAGSLLDKDYDAGEWTHFTPLPALKPPTPFTPQEER